MPDATLAEPVRRPRLIDVAGVLTTPLLPDDYLTTFNPLWSFRELRGRIEEIVPRAPGSATIVIRPGRQWDRHAAGQHLALGVDVNGVRHWRAYSLTSDPGRPDGCVSITVKAVDGGAVSTHLVHHARAGELVRLGPAEGDFTLPAATPDPASMLFVTAGSGITPVMSMLRELDRRGPLDGVVHIHSDRTPEGVIFGGALRAMASNRRVTLHERHTASKPRFAPAELDALCPDWRERDTYACGPAGLLDAIEAHFEAEGVLHRLHVERFELSRAVLAEGDAAGGTVTALLSGTTFEAPAGTSLLEAAETAGLPVKSGCRMGICHTCVCTLQSGQVRDLRTGALQSEPGEHVQLCVSAAAGPVELSI